MMAFYSRHVKVHLTSAHKVTLRKLMYPFHKMQCCCSCAHHYSSFAQNSSQCRKNSSSLYFLPFLIIFLKYDCTWTCACAPVWRPDVFWSTSLVQPSSALATLHHSECRSLFFTRMLEIRCAIPSSDSY